VISEVPLISIVWLFDFDPTTSGGVAAVQYAFGINTAGDSLWFHIGVGPTQWIKVGSGSGGGSANLQVIQYTVTGTEPDVSELTIALSTPQPDANYAVVATCQGVTGIVAWDVPNVTKTTTQFVAIATGKLVAGDVVVFFVSPFTSTLRGPTP